MRKEDSSSGDGLIAAEVEGSPGLAYSIFSSNEELMDKLKILNFETEFIRDLKMKSPSRHYFAVQTNPGEQFFLFTSLAAWLVRKTGDSFEQPQEFDDPNSTIAGLLDSVRKTGTALNFPPSKLKQGCGEHAVSVLNCLADAALKATHFVWQKPEPPPDLAQDEDDAADDEAELILEKVEEEMAAEFSEEEEEVLLRVEDLGHFGSQDAEGRKPDDVLVSTTDGEEWRLELERVLPQLKVTVTAGARDWRARLEQMQQHRASIEDSLAATQGQLDRLHADITHTLDKVGSREKYLNSRLETQLAQYRTLQDELARLTEQYRDVSGGVTERSRTLAQVSEELEAVKRDMEERGSSMNDRTPLVNIKKAVSGIRLEITSMNVHVGVLEHSLLQSKLRDKSLLQQDLNTSMPA
ncbi:intraflagellar transport protein 57 homolog [Bacillus rossius redtenbacheri]|uniref:intraflagellar transport protein 57 homolog n=1 Tax=Bacillus rossius redtenbacheri TaxID=93214 RepID=UPI002FDE2A69